MIAVGSFVLCRTERNSIPLTLIGIPLLSMGFFAAYGCESSRIYALSSRRGTIAVGGFLCAMTFSSLRAP
jgi:hypothetical protein